MGAETSHGQAQSRFTTICLCSDEIRCHDETLWEPMIKPPLRAENALVERKSQPRIPVDWEIGAFPLWRLHKAHGLSPRRVSICHCSREESAAGPNGVHSFVSDLLRPRFVRGKRLFRTRAHQTIGGLGDQCSKQEQGPSGGPTASPGYYHAGSNATPSQLHRDQSAHPQALLRPCAEID